MELMLESYLDACLQSLHFFFMKSRWLKRWDEDGQPAPLDKWYYSLRESSISIAVLI